MKVNDKVTTSKSFTISIVNAKSIKPELSCFQKKANPKCTCTYQPSACVTVANVPLDLVSHMVKPSINVGGNHEKS